MLKKINIDIRNLTNLTVAGFLLYSPVSILAYPVSVLVVNPSTSAAELLIVGLLHF